MKFNIPSKITIVAICAIVLFFIGRWTSPKEDTTPLVQENKRLAVELNATLDTVAYYKAFAMKWYNASLQAGKEKVIHHTVYKHDTTRNYSLTDRQLDSVLIARFTNKYKEKGSK